MAPRPFHSALEEFVRHKGARLVALEDALKPPGTDDPERLKRHLYAAWKRDRVRYVLLVGDVDVLPVRYMVLDRKTKAAFDYAFYPSDLYYADLARKDGGFDDWNGNKEGFHAGYFGEVRGEKNKNDPINLDGIDYLPEVAVGRWPVSTPEEARIAAKKTIAFEKGGRSGRAGLVSVDGWVNTRPFMDRMAKLLEGTAVEKRYTPDSKQVVALLNSGPDLVLHAGHGTDNTWHRCLSLGSLKALTNRSRPPVVFSAGCSTACFAPLPPYDAYVDGAGKRHLGTDSGKEVFIAPPPSPSPYQKEFDRTGLGEKLLLGGATGAVAYIGCNTGSQPCGLTLMEGFVQAYGAGEARLGDCWVAALRHYHRKERLAELKPTESWYPPSIFFQGMKFMLFGDPSLRLR